jgi:hypothetical protein
MSTIKLALVSISAAVLICLGLFSTASADRHTSSSPAVSAASPSTGAAATRPMQSTLNDEGSCSSAPAAAQLTLQSNAVASSGPSTMACPTNTVYTCCRCGGCGCRPRNISPANWCAC